MASPPQAKTTVENVYEVITDITKLAGYMRKEIRQRQEWSKIVERVEAGRVSLCRTLEGETLFSVLNGVHMLGFMDLKAVIKITEKYKKGKEKAVKRQTQRRLQEAKEEAEKFH
jgi:hypothetical protein